MSDVASRLRIRAQPSPRDPDTLHFLLDAPVQNSEGPKTFDGTNEQAPLARALFAISGVRRVAVNGASIHLRKSTNARWGDMKAPIAAAIRAVLTSTDQPLGPPLDGAGGDRDAWLLTAVRALLDSRINPSIASHGGHIGVESVTDGIVYLRMSGGCQGCAASQLTLRGGVERTLRAALPDIENIVDVTDHGAGTEPFYGRMADRAGSVVSPVAGPAPRASSSGGSVEASSDENLPLATRVRRYLEARTATAPTVSYGELARALGLWRSGSVHRITRALENTMREDARTDRPFIAARAVSRATDGLPAKGFFDLARDLSRGPRENDTERAFHAHEIEQLERSAAPRS
ncbi:NifU family protein [Citreimonas salinaria]|uniref:Fe-S cluster biogenesis protein NfuA, 4Fe-4S-binding domain n=1 Tax=Citreimonas salinaria TaxID=321339 RepID=A0A1H3NSP9_9RHOB|nr:NifU family protein [Citreimonas salinaria]SDY91455.1 Fe-S cluster biogenesis protein NfuA, 4Fe-4S-binding domain [Citreimonas salinaria]